MQLIAYLFLVLFGVSLALTYASIRARWLSLTASAAVGTIGSCLFLFLFSMFHGNSLEQGLALGVGLGLLFSATCISVAVFFKANAPRPSTDSPEDHPRS